MKAIIIFAVIFGLAMAKSAAKAQVGSAKTQGVSPRIAGGTKEQRSGLFNTLNSRFQGVGVNPQQGQFFNPNNFLTNNFVGNRHFSPFGQNPIQASSIPLTVNDRNSFINPLHGFVDQRNLGLTNQRVVIVPQQLSDGTIAYRPVVLPQPQVDPRYFQGINSGLQNINPNLLQGGFNPGFNQQHLLGQNILGLNQNRFLSNQNNLQGFGNQRFLSNQNNLQGFGNQRFLLNPNDLTLNSNSISVLPNSFGFNHNNRQLGSTIRGNIIRNNRNRDRDNIIFSRG